MTTEEIYIELIKNEKIAKLEKEGNGVWYIENTVDERRSKPTSYYPSLKEAIKGLQNSSNWFCPKGTGTIYFVGYGIGAPKIQIYQKNDWDWETYE